MSCTLKPHEEPKPPSKEKHFIKPEPDADDTAVKRQELEDKGKRELEAGTARELSAEEIQQLEASETGDEFDTENTRPSQQSLLPEREGHRSGLFEME